MSHVLHEISYSDQRENNLVDIATEQTINYETSYVLLNDQPVESRSGDLLSTRETAEGIASVIMASKISSPFVLAIDAGWGMGKSTLLRQIESSLPRGPDVAKIRFNAWTTGGDDALEGIIKTVLGELDSSIVRRWTRRLARQKHVIFAAWLGVTILARFFGAARLVDELWKQLSGDTRSRNDMRDLIHEMLSDWMTETGTLDARRALVVFIDDLDRCSDDVVVKVCEAIKLYLDVPGIIFVVACDQSALSRSVSLSARAKEDEARVYLEKIVQVVYRVPIPEDTQVRKLVTGYAEQSGIANLIDETVAGILVDGTGRNPRKIKRIINSFVLEHRLDPSWRMQPLGSAQLVRAILLRHLYTSFYDLLIREDSGEDPIGEFLDYVEVRDRLSDPPINNDDPWWDTMRSIFQAHRLLPRWSPEMRDGEAEVAKLERTLPKDFPMLAGNTAFVTLLRGVGDGHARRSLRAQLIRRPLATEVIDSTNARPEHTQKDTLEVEPLTRSAHGQLTAGWNGGGHWPAAGPAGRAGRHG